MFELEALLLLQILALHAQVENLLMLLKMLEKKDVEMESGIPMKLEMMETLIIQMAAVMLVLLKLDMPEMEEMNLALTLVSNV